ncbi:hypothetical protein [Alcanivorax jadensis]|nr:hypothetical protein [Alcanivorax jadensis]MDF1639146.1 hypothetical protein [Alcanivorax jadensis]
MTALVVQALSVSAPTWLPGPTGLVISGLMGVIVKSGVRAQAAFLSD